MTRAYDTAATQRNSGGAVNPFVAGKNKIINGDFRIWQRGTSFTPSAGVVTFTADRWRSVVNSGTTISRQTFTPGTAPVAGYEGQFYLNATITANNQNYEHGQFIEDVRTFAGQTIAVSFWARSTVGAQPMNVALWQNFGTGGSPSSQLEVTATSGTTPFTPTSSWVRYTYTYNVPSVSGKTFGTDNNSYLWLRIGQYTTTATNTSIDYWGVQVEAGSAATAFQTATGTIQGELAACQRYYNRYTAPQAYSHLAQGWAISTDNMTAWFYLPVEMRVVPTAIDYASVNMGDGVNAQITPSTITFTADNNNTKAIACTGTKSAGGMTQYRGYQFLAAGTTAAYIGFSAEL